MHLRTRIRHRIGDMLLDVPNAVLHRDPPLRIDEGMLFDKVSKKFTNHIFVTTLQMDPLGDAEKVLDGCCEISVSLRAEVSLFVSSHRKDIETTLDNLEEVVWPHLNQFTVDSEFAWPELNFTGEITQPSSPEAVSPAYVRSLQFALDLRFNPALPHEIKRL